MPDLNRTRKTSTIFSSRKQDSGCRSLNRSVSEIPYRSSSGNAMVPWCVLLFIVGIFNLHKHLIVPSFGAKLQSSGWNSWFRVVYHAVGKCLIKESPICAWIYYVWQLRRVETWNNLENVGSCSLSFHHMHNHTGWSDGNTANIGLQHQYWASSYCAYLRNWRQEEAVYLYVCIYPMYLEVFQGNRFILFFY